MQEVKMWTEGVPVEHEALVQVRNLASLPVLAGHVAVMPDVHVGKGATVGTVIPTEHAIIPAAVGVDIGCGMCAVKTTLTANDLPHSLSRIRAAIEARVPVGTESHDAPLTPEQDGPEGAALKQRMLALKGRLPQLGILDRVGHVVKPQRIWQQLGSLGSGNHFVEVCLDESGSVWVMLHSGSRNIGKVIGETAITEAREQAHERGFLLPDRDLAWLEEGTSQFDDYVEAMTWAQDYAATNRGLMLHLVLKVLRAHFRERFAIVDEAVNCHHNFSKRETHFGKSIWVTRKGAVSAAAGELGIIPGSMGAKSYIVRGKGNPASYASCAHGAGRRMSRGAAKRQFSVDDLAEQTRGVECRKDSGVIDEIPHAYKDIDAVMAAQADLVEVVATLKQVMCIKG